MRLTNTHSYAVHGPDSFSFQARPLRAHAPGHIRSSQVQRGLPSNQNSKLTLVAQSNVARERMPFAPAFEKPEADVMLCTQDMVELLKVDLQDAVRDGNLGLAEQLADEISQLEWS